MTTTKCHRTSDSEAISLCALKILNTTHHIHTTHIKIVKSNTHTSALHMLCTHHHKYKCIVYYYEGVAGRRPYRPGNTLQYVLVFV